MAFPDPPKQSYRGWQRSYCHVWVDSVDGSTALSQSVGATCRDSGKLIAVKRTVARDRNGSSGLGSGRESADVSDRPIPGTGPHEVVALEKPFTVCGKL
jgi:hypothetical protein